MNARHEVIRTGDYDLQVVCPFTREWAVKPFFDALVRSDVPLARASFIAYVDSDSEALCKAVKRRLRALPCKDVRLHLSGWEPPAERAMTAIRRTRHAAMRLATQGLVHDGPLLLLEDDTLLPHNTFAPLASLCSPWAVGVQVGRWGVKCCGLWHVADREAYTLLPTEQGCNASGLYCVLTTGEVYKALDMWHWDNARGHDVCATYGLDIAVAWDVVTGHLTNRETITLEGVERYRVTFPAPNPMCAATMPVHGDTAPTMTAGQKEAHVIVTPTRLYRTLPNGTRVLAYSAGSEVPEAEYAELAPVTVAKPVEAKPAKAAAKPRKVNK